MHQSAARITMRDIEELNRASEDLFAVSEMIKRANPTWRDGAIGLLVRANDTVVRVQNKGAAAFSRYLQKHGTQGAAGDTTAQGAEERTGDPQKSQPGED